MEKEAKRALHVYYERLNGWVQNTKKLKPSEPELQY